jgi:hypothetical protein
MKIGSSLRCTFHHAVSNEDVRAIAADCVYNSGFNKLTYFLHLALVDLITERIGVNVRETVRVCLPWENIVYDEW